MPYRALPADQLGREPRPVEVAGAQVLLARLPDGEPVAYAAYCPHQGTPLRHPPGADGTLSCQQHHYRYDVRSGANVWPAEEMSPEALERMKPGHLTTYAVVERAGWLWVEEQPNPPPPSRPVGRDDPRSWRAPPPAPAPSPDPVVHPPQHVSTTVGAEFELSLPTQPLPGHLWQTSVDGEAVTVAGQAFVPQNDGQPGVTRLHLVATAPGEATLRCTYQRPWGGTPAQTRTFRLTIFAPRRRS